jgi:hypothetical protein
LWYHKRRVHYSAENVAQSPFGIQKIIPDGEFTVPGRPIETVKVVSIASTGIHGRDHDSTTAAAKERLPGLKCMRFD